MRAFAIFVAAVLGAGLWWWLQQDETDTPRPDGPAELRESEDHPSLVGGTEANAARVPAVPPRVEEPDRPAATQKQGHDRRVEIRMPDGTPAGAVTLRVALRGHEVHFGRALEWTPQAAAVEFGPEDRYVVAETADGLVSEPARIGRSGPVELVLYRPDHGMLVGNIVLPDGITAPNAQVLALRIEDGAPQRPVSMMQLAGPKVLRARMHAGVGGYRFEKLKPGRYQVAMSITSFGEVDDWAIVTIRDRLVRRDLKANMELAPVVKVLVRGSDGELANDAGVRTNYEAPKISSTGGSVLQQGDGVFLIRHDRMWDRRSGTWLEKHPEGVFRVSAWVLNLGKKEVAYDPHRSDPLVFSFGEAHDLTIHVAGIPDEIASEVTMDLSPTRRRDESGLSSGGEQSHDGPSGTFWFRSVQPGDYEARLMWLHQGSGRRFTMVNIERFPVHVAPGGDEIRLSLSKLYEVRVTGVPERASPGLARIDAYGFWTHQILFRSKDSSEHVFRFVPAGRYEVHVQTSRTETRKWPLVVPKQATLRLD